MCSDGIVYLSLDIAAYGEQTTAVCSTAMRQNRIFARFKAGLGKDQ